MTSTVAGFKLVGRIYHCLSRRRNSSHKWAICRWQTWGLWTVGRKGAPENTFFFWPAFWWANPSRSWEKRRSQSRHRRRTKDSANQWHTQPHRERTDCGYQKRGRWCLCMELLGVTIEPRWTSYSTLAKNAIIFKVEIEKIAVALQVKE